MKKTVNLLNLPNQRALLRASVGDCFILTQKSRIMQIYF